MDATRIKELVELVAVSRVAVLEIVEGDTRIRITRDPFHVEIGVPTGSPPSARLDIAPPTSNARPASPQASAGPATDPFIRAPIFGLVHLTPSPGSPPFVRVGEAIRRGRKLALIEAMKVFNAVEADRDGVVSAILVEPGAEIEPGQKLFRIADQA